MWTSHGSARPIRLDDNPGISALDTEDGFVLRFHPAPSSTYEARPEPCACRWAMLLSHDPTNAPALEIAAEVIGHRLSAELSPVLLKMKAGATVDQEWKASSFVSKVFRIALPSTTCQPSLVG